MVKTETLKKAIKSIEELIALEKKKIEIMELQKKGLEQMLKIGIFAAWSWYSLWAVAVCSRKFSSLKTLIISILRFNYKYTNFSLNIIAIVPIFL